MNYLLKTLANIPHDKLLHFIVGMLITALVAIVLPNWAFTSAIIVGVAKEAYDHIDYGKVDWKDLAATIIGGLIMQIFVWIY